MGRLIWGRPDPFSPLYILYTSKVCIVEGGIIMVIEYIGLAEKVEDGYSVFFPDCMDPTIY